MLGYRGASITNDMTPFFVEYCERKALRKMGFVDNISELCSRKTSAFLLIEDVLAKLQNDDLKKKAKRK